MVTLRDIDPDARDTGFRLDLRSKPARNDQAHCLGMSERWNGSIPSCCSVSWWATKLLASVERWTWHLLADSI